MGDWEGTVGLAATVTVPLLSVRIARCRVVRRDDSVVVKAPRYQEVLVVTFYNLPGVYMAQLVATLESCNMSSSNVSGSPPFVVNSGKSPLVTCNSMLSSPDVFPCNKFIASCDGSVLTISNDDGLTGSGTGECMPELPEGNLPVATTSHRNDLQAECGSFPVDNRRGRQVDTQQINMAQGKRDKGQIEIQNQNSIKQGTKISSTRD